MVKVKSLAYYLCMKNDILYINFDFSFVHTYKMSYPELFIDRNRNA